MGQENKTVKGEKFLRTLGMNLPKQSSSSSNDAEDDVAQKKRQLEIREIERQLREQDKRIKEMDEPPPSLMEEYRRLQDKLDNKLEEERAERRRLEDEKLAKEREDRQTTERAYQEERQKREEAERQLQAQKYQQVLDELAKIKELQTSNKTPQEQWDEYEQWARKQGYEKPGAPTGGDPKLALEIKKMDLEDHRAQRDFEWKMEQDKRKWDLEMEKLKDDREFRRAELAQQAKKDEMWATTPERFGRAIASGLIDRGEEGEEETPVTRGGKGKSYHIEIGEGESGEIECPNCGTPVGVGSSTKIAKCVNCNSQFEVARKPGSQEKSKSSEKEGNTNDVSYPV